MNHPLLAHLPTRTDQIGVILPASSQLGRPMHLPTPTAPKNQPAQAWTTRQTIRLWPGASDPLEELDQRLHVSHETCKTHQAAHHTKPKAVYAGFLSYELGKVIEPAAQSLESPVPNEPSPWPLIELHQLGQSARVPDGYNPLPTPTTPVPLNSQQGRNWYLSKVKRGLEAIKAGDIYQANIAHQLQSPFTGDPYALYAQLAHTAQPAWGLALCSPDPLPDGSSIAILSLSPERFLSYDASTRRLITQPMKGTRRGSCDPDELLNATKDRAELAMIVDLMRNDLGRVCEFGSVTVSTPRHIEQHAISSQGAVLQATATVEGIVRQACTTADILRATFPPGSVTGAPKIRAMQLIDQLEAFNRHAWCGCHGIFYSDGSFELGVSIRTILIKGPKDPQTKQFINANLTYCIGAGIVADSDPHAEWLETLDKARILEPVFSLPAQPSPRI